jgi:hypothetical protein
MERSDDAFNSTNIQFTANIGCGGNNGGGGTTLVSNGTNGGVTSNNNNNIQIDNQRPAYTIPGILHYLQHEWARFDYDRQQWEADRAELLVIKKNKKKK